MLALAHTFITSSAAQCDASWTTFLSASLERKNKVRTSFVEGSFVVCRVDAKCQHHFFSQA